MGQVGLEVGDVALESADASVWGFQTASMPLYICLGRSII